MTIKELMEQVDENSVTEAFILVSPIFMSVDNELSIAERFQVISKVKEKISHHIRLFRESTFDNTLEEYTVFITDDLDAEDYEDKTRRILSSYAIRDKEALSVLDKDFFLYTDKGEIGLAHYCFEHKKVNEIAAYNIAKSSIEKLGKEICAAKILSDMFFWGFSPDVREKSVSELMEQLEKPHDSSEYVSKEEHDNYLNELRDNIKQKMTEDDRAYWTAKERFEVETKDIVLSYWKQCVIEREKQHIAAIREEYLKR